MPLPNTLRTRRAAAAVDGEVYRVIAAHRAAGDPGAGGDLLDLLLAARDDETGGGLSDREVRDEAVTLLLAGHETTAVALTWTWALLAQNPDAQAQLQAEADALDGPPTSDDLARLGYTRAVFAEAMRLYPPAWSYGREAARPLDLGGVPVAPGTTVLFGPLWLHADPRFWDRPERFDPDRWAPERKAGPPQVRLPPVQRRPARVHRRAVRLARGRARARDGRAPLAAVAGRARPGHARLGHAAAGRPGPHGPPRADVSAAPSEGRRPFGFARGVQRGGAALGARLTGRA